jgi:hypothetical protein
MVTKQHLERVAGVLAAVTVYASAPVAERAKGVAETADPSHRKDDAVRDDEGERGEVSGVLHFRVDANDAASGTSGTMISPVHSALVNAVFSPVSHMPRKQL